MPARFNRSPRRRPLRLLLHAAAVVWLSLAVRGHGAEVTRAMEYGRLSQGYKEARARYEAASNSIAPSIDFSRACAKLAEFATNSAQRAMLAEQGLAASRAVLSLDPTNVAAQCCLGLNLGQLARTKTLGALKIVPQIEAAWRAAVAVDPRFNYAGPHRLLGLLYDGAPGWPLSIGSRSLARTNFALSVALAPDYADNWLCYVEACLGWDDLKTARSLITKTSAAMAKARQTFTGPDWAWELQDWEKRWAEAQKRLETAEKRARNATHRQRMKDD